MLLDAIRSFEFLFLFNNLKSKTTIEQLSITQWITSIFQGINVRNQKINRIFFEINICSFYVMSCLFFFLFLSLDSRPWEKKEFLWWIDVYLSVVGVFLFFLFRIYRKYTRKMRSMRNRKKIFWSNNGLIMR